jgi:hypothetical protein
MAPLHLETSDRSAGTKDAGTRVLPLEPNPSTAIHDKTIEDFNIGVWVFGALSLLTLLLTLIRGIVPIELLEAMLWAVLAWLWNKRSTTNRHSKEVVTLFAILLAGSQGYLLGGHAGLPTRSGATNPNLLSGAVLDGERTIGSPNARNPFDAAAGLSPSPSPPAQGGADPYAKYIVAPTAPTGNVGDLWGGSADATTKGKHGLKGAKSSETTSTNRLEEPDMSKLSGEEESSIEQVCFLAKGDGPAAYITCLKRQLSLLAKAPPRPDLSALNGDEESSIEQACFLAKGDGPAAYNRCLTRQLRLLGIHPRADKAPD